MKNLPPSETRRVDILRAFADKLRKNPMDWQPLPRARNASTTGASIRLVTSAINVGRYVSLPNTEFEAAHRNGVIYVRYIGPAANKAVPA